MTLTEFLRARIAEDEAVAKALLADLERQIEAEGFGSDEKGPFTPDRMLSAQLWAHYDGQTRWRNFARGQHIATLSSPARVLAECDAKRYIVDIHSGWHTCPDEDAVEDDDATEPAPCLTLRILAAVYTSHPDYLPEWRP